jgi:hypothetical protein
MTDRTAQLAPLRSEIVHDQQTRQTGFRSLRTWEYASPVRKTKATELKSPKIQTAKLRW